MSNRFVGLDGGSEGKALSTAATVTSQLLITSAFCNCNKHKAQAAGDVTMPTAARAAKAGKTRHCHVQNTNSISRQVINAIRHEKCAAVHSATLCSLLCKNSNAMTARLCQQQQEVGKQARHDICYCKAQAVSEVKSKLQQDKTNVQHCTKHPFALYDHGNAYMRLPRAGQDQRSPSREKPPQTSTSQKPSPFQAPS